jgi:hypothetical protein
MGSLPFFHKYRLPGMRLHIGHEAIKVTFIQTRPGAEFLVAQKLAEACRRAGVRKYTFFKGLGGYDIILLYLSDFGFHLTRYGLISGILQSNTFLCFPYRWTENSDQPSEVIDALNTATFAGFSLVKFNYDGVTRARDADEIFFSNLNTKFPGDAHSLGSLGWNELVLVLTQDSLSRIIENCFCLSLDPSLCRLEPYFFRKTLSYVAINYNEILGPDWESLPLDNLNPRELRELLESVQTTGKLAEPFRQDILPTVCISAPPGPKYQEIKGYWQDLGFKCLDALGEEDFLASPTAAYKGTWGKFLIDILYFRLKYRKLIQSTTTVLSYDSPGSHGALEGNQDGNSVPFDDLEIFSHSDYPYEDLESFFGKKGAPSLAAQIYALNSLSHNPITGSVFRGLKEYPRLIMARGTERYIKNRENPDEALGYKFTEVLGHGLELRSYGTYGNVERPYGRYATLKGGVQRALMAMEYLPTKILDRASPDFWFGFINAYEESKFFELQEVIYVPLESLWKPETWWALYHESGHIIVDRYPILASDDIQVIKCFLAPRTDPVAWSKLFIELAAEVIGYELGYFGDLDFLLATLWPHLQRIEETLKDYATLKAYLIRTFFVEIWEKCYGKLAGNLDGEKCDIGDYYNDEYLYKSLLEHIGKIEKILGKTFPEKDFAISSHMSYFKDVLPFINYLYYQLSELETKYDVIIFRRKSWIEDPTAQDIAKNLLNGKVYWEEIEHPEAVFYHILKNQSKTDNFPFVFATILTFWNAQVQWLKRAPYARYRSV